MIIGILKADRERFIPILYVIATDDLTMQGVRVSEAMVLT